MSSSFLAFRLIISTSLLHSSNPARKRSRASETSMTHANRARLAFESVVVASMRGAGESSGRGFQFLLRKFHLF